MNTELNTELNTPTPRTNELYLRHANYCDQEEADEAIEDLRDLASTLERELHESRNAERLARVQLGNERARLDELISVNATGAARLAHATAQLAAEREKVQRLVEINEFVGSAQLKAEREKVRALRLACERIVAEWDDAHDTNPIGAGGIMYTRASFALAATEDAQ